MNFSNMFFGTYVIYYPMPVAEEVINTVAPPTIEKQTEQKPTKALDIWECQRHFLNFMQLIQGDDEKERYLDWSTIMHRLQRRTIPSFAEFHNIYSGGMERYRMYMERRKVSWGQDDLLVFFWLLDRYCIHFERQPKDLQAADWDYVARMVPFRTGEQCMFKYLSMQKNRLEDYPWDSESEKYLYELANLQDKKDWIEISKKLYKAFPNVYRSPKQCREHWSLNLNNFFDKSKTFWSSEEDLKLLELYTEYGRRWKRISYSLVGRSENAIKNRFSLLWAKYKKRKSKDDIKEIREILEKRQKKTPSKDDPSKNGLEITNSSLEEQSKEEVREKIEPGLENQQQ